MKKKVITNALEILDRKHPPTAADRKARAKFAQMMDVAEQIYALRTAAGLTQKALARLVGTSESVISRLEDADYDRHSMAMLRRIAGAMGQRVEVRFVPAKRELEHA
ncbi:MAG: helix-turn-helix domain-containing protein [Phycisphaerae bacterium]